MELRRVADSLLRSQTSSLPAFLTPSISRWASNTQTSFRYAPNAFKQRSISSSTRCSMAARPTITTTPAPAENSTDKKPDDIAESLGWVKAGMGGNRTNRFGSINTRTENKALSPNANESELAFNNGNSARDLLSAFNLQQALRRGGGIDVNGMATPKPTSGTDMMRSIGESMHMVPAKTPMRLTPTTGRTVTIGAGIDVGRGFRLLEQSCARNRVRRDFTQQRFHERGGLKRKRLRRERWRKSFMAGFKAAVIRVKHLKAQGW